MKTEVSMRLSIAARNKVLFLFAKSQLPSDGHSDFRLEDSEFPEPDAVSENDVSDGLFDLGRVHQHSRQQVQEDVIAVGLLRHRVAEGHLQRIHRFQNSALAYKEAEDRI